MESVNVASVTALASLCYILVLFYNAIKWDSFLDSEKMKKGQSLPGERWS